MYFSITIFPWCFVFKTFLVHSSLYCCCKGLSVCYSSATWLSLLPKFANPTFFLLSQGPVLHKDTYTAPGLCVCLRTNSTCVTDFTVCLFAVDFFYLNSWTSSVSLWHSYAAQRVWEFRCNLCLCFLLGWPQSAKFIILSSAEHFPISQGNVNK